MGGLAAVTNHSHQHQFGPKRACLSATPLILKLRLLLNSKELSPFIDQRLLKKQDITINFGE
jgi:hypothetical protein